MVDDEKRIVMMMMLLMVMTMIMTMMLMMMIMTIQPAFQGLFEPGSLHTQEK